MTKIKICGLKTLEDIEAVNRWKPDYAGFVFAPSRRQVTPETAVRLRKALDKEILAVGVFVNAPIEEIVRLADSGVIQIIQLHGDEDGSYMEALKARTEAPVIKAVPVKNKEDILVTQKLPCEYLLLDTYYRDSRGGKGQTFDWEMIPPMEKPWFLAGGLTPENVEQALKATRPFGVDVSSGVELSGKKDQGRIREFIEKVRG